MHALICAFMKFIFGVCTLMKAEAHTIEMQNVQHASTSFVRRKRATSSELFCASYIVVQIGQQCIKVQRMLHAFFFFFGVVV